MTASIFPGLGEPKSKLFFNIQAMIAENGGRLHLADTLESEWAKLYLPHSPNPAQYRHRWLDSEVEYIKANYQTMTDREIGEHLNRTRYEVMSKLFQLYKKGMQKRIR